jgi:tetratricopeptide (TPR) repeat protein
LIRGLALKELSITKNYPMTDTSVLSLLHQLRKRTISVNDLSPDEVEKLLVYVLRSESGQSCIVEDYTGKGGPIDVVVRCTHTTPANSVQTAANFVTVTYIECKHYKRKLELDTVAKVFIVAIVDKPNQLIIVSSSDLGPQARRCADYLFATPRTRDETSTVLAAPRSVTSTNFCLRKIEDVFGIKSNQEEVSAAVRIEKTEWTLTEETPFWTKTLGPDSTTIFFSQSNNYWVHIRPNRPAESTSLVDVYFEIIGSDKTKKRLKTELEHSPHSQDGWIKAEIPVGRLPPTESQITFKLGLILEWKSLGKRFTTRCPLFGYHLNRSLPDFEDLRQEQSELWIAEFLKNPSKRILLLHGEGGTGKTWFANLVASRFQKNHPAICQVVSIDETSSIGVLREIAWGLMMPNLPLPNGGVDIGSFIRAWMEPMVRTSQCETFYKVLVDLLNPGTSLKQDGNASEGTDIEQLAQILSILIAQVPIPSLIIFRDCHRASFALSQVLKHLFRNLSNRGWGKTRIILEFRDEIEATDNWRAFLESSVSQFCSVAIDRPLNSVTSEDVERVLTSFIVGEQAAPLAEAVFTKTGGNPLLIRHLLLYFRAKGFILPIDSTGTRFRIEGFGDIIHEIDTDIEQPRDVLPLRVGKMIGSLQAKTREHVLAYLIGASFTGQRFKEEIFRNGSSCSEEDWGQARQILLDTEVIEQSLHNESFQFVHEFMLLAVRSVVASHAYFRTYGAKLLNVLSPRDPTTCTIGGALLLSLRRPAEALKWFDIGQESAKSNGTLLLREHCLTGAYKALAMTHHVTLDVIRKRSAVSLELASTLTQTGSQIRALQTLMRVRKMLDGPQGRQNLSTTERNLINAAILQRRLTLLVRLMKGEEFFEEFARVKRDRIEGEYLHYALTRYILMASHCNQVGAALEAIPLAAGTYDPQMGRDVLSSLYSTIGRFYLQFSPHVAEEYWKRAHDLAKEPRESSHSKLNLRVLSLYLARDSWNSDEIQQLEQEILKQGVVNQLCRLWNYAGIMALAEDKLVQASDFFERALSHSQVSDQPFWQWKSHNNFAICLLKSGEEHRAKKHFEAALAMISSFARTSKLSDGIVLQPLHDLASHNKLLQRSNLLLECEAPTFSGLFPVVILNVHALTSLFDDELKLPDFNDSGSWPCSQLNKTRLLVNVNGTKLALAIE